MRNVNKDYSLEDYKHEVFIHGRSAVIKVDGKRAGIIGEIHPGLLKSKGLENPVVCFELSVDKIKKNK